MQVRCPYCQASIDVAQSGQYTCARCRAIFRVDLGAAAPPSHAPPLAAEPRPFGGPAGGTGAPPSGAPAPSARPITAPPPGARCANHPDREAVAVCDRCGNFGCHQCSLPLPQGRFCPACAERVRGADYSTPWERRQELGWGRALKETTSGVLFHPTEFFRRMPRAAGYDAPILYMIVWTFAGQVAQGILQLVMFALFGTAAMQRAGAENELEQVFQAMALGGGVTIVSVIVNIICAPIAAVIGAFVVGGICHLGLLITGGAKNGFEATVRVVCYWQSFTVLNVILLPVGLFLMLLGLAVGPEFGALAGMGVPAGVAALAVLFWGLPVFVIGCREAHETTTGRALGIFLVPILLGCCVVGFAAAVGGLAAFSSLPR